MEIVLNEYHKKANAKMRQKVEYRKAQEQGCWFDDNRLFGDGRKVI